MAVARANLRSLRQVIVEKNGQAVQRDPVGVYDPKLATCVERKDAEGLYTIACTIKEKILDVLQLPDGAKVRTGGMNTSVSFEDWANQHVHAVVQEGSPTDAFEPVTGQPHQGRVRFTVDLPKKQKLPKSAAQKKARAGPSQAAQPRGTEGSSADPAVPV